MKPVFILQNCEIESSGLVADYLLDTGLPFREVMAFSGEQLPTVDKLSCLVLLGTPTSVTECRKHPFLVSEFELIAEALRAEHPILGICFGAQLLAHVMGARVGPNKVKEIGVDTVKLTEDGQVDDMMAGLEKELTVFQWHGDTFRIPFGATHLAASERCKNQAFRKGNAAGLQFHIETNPTDIPRWCEAYAAELAAEKLDANTVIRGFEDSADEIQRTGRQLLHNYFTRVAGLA
jgi:GMP synthase (glutamine-hydrolysing)